MKPAKDCNSIDEVRLAIDTLDKEIIKLLGKRYEYVKEIVRFKNPDPDSIIAKDRYESVIASRREIAENEGLNPEIIEKIYKTLIHHFIDEEMKIIKNINK